MSVLKCKMCGGALEINEETTVVECEYCGSKQTIPTVDNEKKLSLFARANKLRAACEFDKAAGVYESIVADFSDEAEAYWGLILCKYGIEYVDDPATGKKVPTCHRSSFDSVLDSSDFEMVMENADAVARKVYRDEAKVIEDIRKSIIEVSSKEEPYDIFICYKETDEKGDRTIDSVIAQDVYNELTEKGYRVFFSRITLEDKLGQEYEPYIFAALNSAKVMLAFGTDYEYYNAVWVKNEWSRFLYLIAKGEKKTLIPCYKNIDAYDMPKEFAKLQAQDMGKLGAIQDLVRGIEKIIPRNETAQVKETVVVNNGGANATIDSLLKRVFMFLEDGNFKSAEEYCEKVLDVDPENAQAYLGKLMAYFKVTKRVSLKNSPKPLDDNLNYKKAIRFADTSLKNELEGYVTFIKERNLNTAYTNAMDMMNSAKTDKEFKNAAAEFEKINEYKDSASKAQLCLEKSEEARLEQIYSESVNEMNFAKTEQDFLEIAYDFNSIKDYKDSANKEKLCLEKAEEARLENLYNIAFSAMDFAKTETEFKDVASNFKELKNYKDSAKKAKFCLEKAEELRLEAERLAEEKRIADEKAKEEAEALAKKNKKLAMIITPIVAVLLAIVMVYTMVIIPNGKYDDAVALMEAGKYEEAFTAFDALNGHKDSEEKSKECKYNYGKILTGERKYREAFSIFASLGDYKDSKECLMVRETLSTGGALVVALKQNGTVCPADIAPDWKDIVAVSAGEKHVVGLKSNGTVVAVGDNYYGQCNVSDWKDIIAIYAGYSHTVGIKADGTVVAVGFDTWGQCDVSNWTDIIAVSASCYNTVGLKSDGTVVVAGSRSHGYEQSDVDYWKDIIAISACANHLAGLKSDGTVVTVGNNDEGQRDVGEWTDIIAIAAGTSRTVGLKSDGTVIMVGDDFIGEYNESEWTDLVAISAGGYRMVGLKSDGTVVATGGIENGDFTNIKLPDDE